MNILNKQAKEVNIFYPIPDPLIKCDFENVYAPSDDTYLLIDYFKRNFTQNYFDGIPLNTIKNVLDLGTGTGIIAILFQFLKIYNPIFNPKIHASDILDKAIDCAKENEALNNIKNQIKFLQSNLFGSFPATLHDKFNIIVFNPPYLPSSHLIKEENNKRKIDSSWDGGLKGYEHLIEFLTKARPFLNTEEDHYIYCITSSRTNLIELHDKIRILGFKIDVVDKKHIFFEDIILNRLEYD